ncbi:MAG: hypothetical protein ACREVJ_12625, partial [Gammaproteobacteria bacterium]
MPATELARRIKLAPPGSVLDLAHEPMGAQSLDRFDGLNITVRGGLFDSLNLFRVPNLAIESPLIQMVFEPSIYDRDGALIKGGTATVSAAFRAKECPRVRLIGDARLIGCFATTGVTEEGSAKLDKTGNAIGFPTGTAVRIEASPDSVIDGIEGEQFAVGVVHVGSANALIRRAALSRLRTTGFKASGASGYRLEYSSLTDSRPWAYGDTMRGGDHAAGVHLSTTIGSQSMARVILYRNAFIQGAGAPLIA